MCIYAYHQTDAYAYVSIKAAELFGVCVVLYVVMWTIV